MANFKVRQWGAILGVTFIVGCSGTSTNEGASDYRAMIGSNKSLAGMFFKGSEVVKPIKPGETVTIKLLRAHICDFTEFSLTEWVKTANNSPKCDNGGNGYWYDAQTATGEIAIVAKAFERKKGNSLSFNYSDIKKDGRLIFYSQDVAESGQLLNFANLPIYGPITYSGKPFNLEFNILELDNNENSNMQAIMQTLATIGGQAYPPSSGSLEILNALGGSLLSGDKDDLELRYLLEFDSYKLAREKDEYHLPLTTGTYAFVRQENRSVDFDWGEEVTLDPATGLLVEDVTGTGSKKKTYRKRTWFTIRVSSGEDATDQDAGQLFSEFLQKNQDITDQNIEELTSKLTSLGGSIAQLKHFTKAKGSIGQLKVEDAVVKSTAQKQLATILCEAIKTELENDKKDRFFINESSGFCFISVTERYSRKNS